LYTSLPDLQEIAMPKSQKDRIAEEVMQLWASFQVALSDKRKYPTAEFTSFALSVRQYVQVVGPDPLIHREIVGAINGLVDFLVVERKLVPEEIVAEANRLESLVFAGYDPHFEGDEPPGL
jgi:hypothetical protein